MSRSLSSGALRAMFSAETGDYPILLLTITHPSLPVPIRVSSDSTQRVEVTGVDIVYGTISRGMTFVYIPFSLPLPSDGDDGGPATALTLDNVGREMIPTIRAMSGPATVSMELVISSSLDVVEATFPDFDLTHIGYDDLTITGNLGVDSLVSEPFPAGSFTPSQFPAMF